MSASLDLMDKVLIFFKVLLFFFFNWSDAPKGIGGLWHPEGAVPILSIGSAVGEGRKGNFFFFIIMKLLLHTLFKFRKCGT